MPSQLRSDTARANGAKSRGPKSAETWEKSSRNSLRHLFTSRHTILLECENEDEFQELEDDFAASLTYTGTGKRTLISGARTFTYDFENRVKSMNGGAVTLQYDGHGNRTVKTVNGVTTRYLVNDLNPTGYPQVVGEIVGSAVQRTYTYGLQRISHNQLINSTWTSSFYGYDGFGSVRPLSDTAGTVNDTYDYDALGNTVNITGSTPNAYLYRGELFDPDLGLYYLRARYYNPATGRLLSRDPEAGTDFNQKTLHKYLYVGGDQ